MIEQLSLMTATLKRDYRWFRITHGAADELSDTDAEVAPFVEVLSRYTREQGRSLVMYFDREPGRWGVLLGRLPSARRDHYGRMITVTLGALFGDPEAARAFALNILAELDVEGDGLDSLSDAVRVSLKEADDGNDLSAYVEKMSRPAPAAGVGTAASSGPLLGNYPRHLRQVGEALRGLDLQTFGAKASIAASPIPPLVVVAEDVDAAKLSGVWRALTNLVNVPEMIENKKKAAPPAPAPSADARSRATKHERIVLRVAVGLTIAAALYAIYRLMKH